MSQTLSGKISKFQFKNEWVHKPSGKTCYDFEVWFEGNEQPYILTAQDRNPEHLVIGTTMYYEWKNESQRKIRRVLPPQTETKTGTFTDNSVGQMVGNALSNAAILVSHGITDPEQVKKVYEVANLICGFSSNLKTEFSNNKN